MTFELLSARFGVTTGGEENRESYRSNDVAAGLC
jgi:hypothetical protein